MLLVGALWESNDLQMRGASSCAQSPPPPVPPQNKLYMVKRLTPPPPPPPPTSPSPLFPKTSSTCNQAITSPSHNPYVPASEDNVSSLVTPEAGERASCEPLCVWPTASAR
ncbi:hypothetical protein BaRGS_00010550 [Batillaria attramentaria]|uniref:Uncharacterized protein n=1 Tax=Batillaria attramentaria TaxID=370345 RepID=A0ABD0LFR9_9CAEN